MNYKTESFNKNITRIDTLSSEDFVQAFLQEDRAVLLALDQAKSQIATVIDVISARISQVPDYLITYDPKAPETYSGARVFYLGAGTSGRLGVLDAAECVPTFSSHPDMFQGVIAGGNEAMFRAVEGAEDDAAAGAKFVRDNLRQDDIVIGISASGSAPYVGAALEEAQRLGLVVIAIANNPGAQIFDYADHRILLDTGAEILSGSTRLKAGTAQKIALNIISTGVMVKLGKVYKNLMVDVQATNIKLVARAVRLTCEISKASPEQAQKALEESNYRVKHACLKILRNLDYAAADALLKKNKGFLKDCIDG